MKCDRAGSLSAKLLPNFFIAGAPKAGTSSLHTWINAHPNAIGSVPKETYYFVDPGSHMHRPDSHISEGIGGYRRFFPIAGPHEPVVIFESTPAYMYSDTALMHLPDLPTKPLFLFVLREPGAQIFSLYRYFRNNWGWIPATMSFADYIQAVRKRTMDFDGNELAANALNYARYADFLVRWRDRVGSDRMQVRLFDDLLADERAFTKRIATWLGLDQAFFDGYRFPRDNATYTVRNIPLQKLNVAVRQIIPKGMLYSVLRSFYRKLNTRRSDPMAASDLDALNALRADFKKSNARLEQEFGIDIASWSNPKDPV